MMLRNRLSLSVLLACALVVAACAPAAPPAPEPAPPEPAAPAPPPPPAEKPPEAPAEKPAEPAEKPAEEPAAEPLPFDEQAVADFYEGSTIRFLVGFAAGGSYDLATRILARHFSRYMPGNPTVIVENRPGASGLIVANEVYHGVHETDGTVLGTFNSQLILQEAVGKEGIEFDSRQFNWIGSMMDSPNACIVRADAGIDSIQEVIDGEEFIIGAVAVGSTTFDIPAILREALDANITIVPGYSGTATIRTAVESGEVHGMCTQFADIKSGVPHWFEGPSPLAKFLFVAADQAPDDPLVEGVPTIPDVVATDEGRLLLDVAAAPIAIAIPYAVAPEVPEERVAALRYALEQVINDPEFWADAEQANFDAGPSTWEQVEAQVNLVLDSPPEVLDTLRPIME